MPDLRTKREKLEAMAAQSASPAEAAVAAALLRRLDAVARGGETPAFLSREAILAQRDASVQPVTVRYWDKALGYWVTFDLDEFLSKT